MNYKNAKNILPRQLLKEIQKHIDGELIYIPKLKENRLSWGQNSGAKDILLIRNKEIYYKYESGYTVNEIIKEYNLSESSIRKIIVQIKKDNR